MSGIVEYDLQPLSRSQTAGAPAGRASDVKLDQACRDFESLFVQYMLKEMRQTVPSGGLFGGGQAEQLYTGMLDTELAKTISSQRGIGLAAVLYKQIADLAVDPEKGSD